MAILGGGVAGLSAAHELCERGFEVSVYEKKAIFGGKARSLSVAGTHTGGRKDLPGEHGFRFFPGFYKHLPDTMSRIPFGAGSSVVENLVAARRILVTRAGRPSIDLLARLPEDASDFVVALQVMLTGIGVPDDEVLYFVDRLLVLLTTCPERRLKEYEQIAWWDFIGAGQRSAEYQTLLAQGLTRSLVALRADVGSTRTVGYILLQLFFGIITSSGFDRLLNGPTNEVWLSPWVDYLESKNVRLESGVTIQQFQMGAGGIAGVLAAQDGQQKLIQADYYLAAMPIEIMSGLVTDAMKAAAPSLSGLSALITKWMNGIQFYLKSDVPLDPGHTLYADSPWALTSISQRQFWRNAPLSNYGDGTVGGILSVDISDWDAAGIVYGKPAQNCTAAEIKDEVWAQLKTHLNVSGRTVIDDANLITWFLDPDIEFPNASLVTNQEPLLVNTVGSLKYRPEAATEIANLFVASDYVRTYTDIACMEAANEAARRAVNGILAQSGSMSAPARLWPLEEPPFFAPMIEYDRLRFQLGLPHAPL
ncbi:MAG TPA: FAD-dependent oxidoreductase [Bryobacteraceae bacterium]